MRSQKIFQLIMLTPYGWADSGMADVEGSPGARFPNKLFEKLGSACPSPGQIFQTKTNTQSIGKADDLC